MAQLQAQELDQQLYGIMGLMAGTRLLRVVPMDKLQQRMLLKGI
jgi:hypothetical protein